VALASGWNVGGVAQFSSGIPFTPYVGFDRAGDLMSDTLQQKPNVNGAVVYPHTATQWFDPASNATIRLTVPVEQTILIQEDTY